MKIGIVSVTLNAANPMASFVKGQFESWKIEHYVDTGITAQIEISGGLNSTILDRFETMIKSAKQDQVSGIIMTCTVFSMFADFFSERYDLPIVAADVAMLESVIKSGEKSALVYTFKPTEVSLDKLIKDLELKYNRKLNGEKVFVPYAYEALQKNNGELHNELVISEIYKVKNNFERIVLCQISMAHLADLIDIEIPVDTSPRSALNLLIKKIEGDIS